MKDHQNIVSGLKNDMISHAKAVKLLLTCSRQWAVMGITIVMDAVYPFISIYLSAMLLDALYEGRSLRQMILFALLGAGAALLVTLTRHWVAKRKNTLWWTMHFRIAEPVMEKTMKMDYELTEDAEVAKMRSRQNDSEKRGSLEQNADRFSLLCLRQCLLPPVSFWNSARSAGRLSAVRGCTTKIPTDTALTAI